MARNPALKLSWFLLLAAAAVSACSAQPPSERPRVRAELGMPISDLHRQPAVAGQPARLRSDQLGLILLRQPHLLELIINRRVMRIEGGGDTAATWITNSPRLAGDSEGSPTFDRIGSIRFDMNAELVTLSDAIGLANDICRTMQLAGLRPTRAEDAFAAVQSWAGQPRRMPLMTFAHVEEAFLDPHSRPETIGACNVSDGSAVFEVEIRNYRRARERYRDTEATSVRNESALHLERAYRVAGELTWDFSSGTPRPRRQH